MHSVHNSTPEREQMAIRWIRWLSKEEIHYETVSGMHASFGEILLLIAIHFHGNNLEAITELVCSVLGMKIRLSSLTRIKTLFTQELFTEKVCLWDYIHTCRSMYCTCSGMKQPDL